jgi:hypothetical protein
MFTMTYSHGPTPGCGGRHTLAPAATPPSSRHTVSRASAKPHGTQPPSGGPGHKAWRARCPSRTCARTHTRVRRSRSRRGHTRSRAAHEPLRNGAHKHGECQAVKPGAPGRRAPAAHLCWEPESERGGARSPPNCIRAGGVRGYRGTGTGGDELKPKHGCCGPESRVLERLEPG